jgi:hypothetical protein
MLGHKQRISKLMSAEHLGASLAQLCFHVECSKGLGLDNKNRAPAKRRTIHLYYPNLDGRTLAHYE